MPKTMPPDPKKQAEAAARWAVRRKRAECDHGLVRVRDGGGWECILCKRRMTEREAMSPRGTPVY